MLKLKLWANPNITWNTRSSRRTRRAWKTRSMRALPCSAHWWFIAAVGRTRHLKAHNTQLKREKTHFCSILLHDANYMFSAVFSVVDRNAGNVTWLGDCTFPSFSFSCNRLLFMLIKSWQVNKQVPALINVSDCGAHCDTKPFQSSLVSHHYPLITADNMQTFDCMQANVSEGLLQSCRLTVVHRDAGVSVSCQNVAAVTATQEATHCVHTLMVAHVAARLFTLIDVCVCERERKKFNNFNCTLADGNYMLQQL